MAPPWAWETTQCHRFRLAEVSTHTLGLKTLRHQFFDQAAAARFRCDWSFKSLTRAFLLQELCGKSLTAKLTAQVNGQWMFTPKETTFTARCSLGQRRCCRSARSQPSIWIHRVLGSNC